MLCETFQYRTSGGWSVGKLPAVDSSRTLVVVFGAPKFLNDTKPIQEILSAYPSSHVVGCSTSGEIFGTSLYDESLAVGLIRFERTEIATAIEEVGSSSESRRTGQRLAAQLNRPGLRAVLVLSDGVRVNGSELVRGLNAVLPDSAVVTGGLAGDGDRFQNTWSLCNGHPRPGMVCAVGLYGDRVRVGHGSKGGWDIFGPQRRVTRSEANVLFELDGKPALELYKEYLGDRARELPASALLFPLALQPKGGRQKQLVRTVLSVDETAQSMTFAGDIPQDSLVQLMRANFERLIDGAADSALMAGEPTNNSGPTLCVAISCVGRRLVLGERTEEELEATLSVLPPGTKQIGFYSYGELSPFASGHCDLHNQTMTLTTISET